MGALAEYNSTESAQTVNTTAALLLAAKTTTTEEHDVVIINRGTSTIYVKFTTDLTAANASNGVDFWHPVTAGECASFRGLTGSGAAIFAKADSTNTLVYARRIPAAN